MLTKLVRGNSSLLGCRKLQNYITVRQSQPIMTRNTLKVCHILHSWCTEFPIIARRTYFSYQPLNVAFRTTKILLKSVESGLLSFSIFSTMQSRDGGLLICADRQCPNLKKMYVPILRTSPTLPSWLSMVVTHSSPLIFHNFTTGSAHKLHLSVNEIYPQHRIRVAFKGFCTREIL